jgi:hypothetical protein
MMQGGEKPEPQNFYGLETAKASTHCSAPFHYLGGHRDGHPPATVQFSVVGSTSGTFAFAGVLVWFATPTVHKLDVFDSLASQARVVVSQARIAADRNGRVGLSLA